MPHKDPEKAREYWRKRYHENTKHNPKFMERRKRQSLAWYNDNKTRQRGLDIKRKYDLDYAEYENMVCLQGNCCAICKEPFLENLWPCVDHDHVSGKVRGILCHMCNLALGNAKDNPEILRTMAAYLEVHGNE